MVNMAKVPDDVFGIKETEQYKKLSSKNVLTLFIYNKNYYFNGENKQIDENNFKVRTEMRGGISVAPVCVFENLDGVKYENGILYYNNKVLDLNNAKLTPTPFMHLGHLYVPVKETANALGLKAISGYKDRLTVIGTEKEVEAIENAFKENESLAVAAASLVVGKYDAYKFTHEDFKAAKDKWRKSIVGSPETIDLNDEGMKAKLKSIEKTAEKLINTMNRGENIPILWGTEKPTLSHELMDQYSMLSVVAKAFGTYGTKYYKDEKVKADILFALRWMYENMYGVAELEERGWRSIHAFNWWYWYCGAPECLTDTILIMEEYLTKEQVNDYMMLFKWLLDNWRLEYTQDQCSGRMAVGTKAALILEDPERLTISSNDYHIMLDIVLTGPGTHTDYCNYQHGLPYNLSYGFSNLHRVLRVGANLAGTPLEFASHRYYNQFMLFKYMFDAAIFRGRGFKSFKGRGVTDFEIGSGVEAGSLIVPMIGNYGPEEDDFIRRFIKYSMVTPENKEKLKNAASISAYKTINDIFLDESLPNENTRKFAHAWFSADRAAQQRGNYAFSLAMPSYRHPSYECINHCNKTGWYTGDGSLMLYTVSDPEEYNGENFVLNERYAAKVPGTTVDMRKREAVSISEGWYPSDEKVGCMDFDKEFIVAGMDYTSYNMPEAENKVDKGHGGGNPKFINDLVAKKAYFMFDKECVCIGAGINSTMESDIVTTVENHRLFKLLNNKLGDDVISVNGEILENTLYEKTYENPKFARMEDLAGYVFFDAENVSVSKYTFAYDKEIAAEYNKEAYVPDVTKEPRPFMEIAINHGKNPVNASYAYAVLPYASESLLKAYSDKPEIEIISNTDKIQSVRKESLGITGIIFYDAAECANIKVNTASIVTYKELDGKFKIKVAEPTNKVDTITVEIDKKLKLISCANRYEIKCGEKTTLTLNIALSQGEGYEAEFEII
ncbi:MAG: hypothetical protein E7564_10280 [Ruminococcaceae bacterium]|nr:hypothetical protein [Oscillospiraceae bacterium]